MNKNMKIVIFLVIIALIVFILAMLSIGTDPAGQLTRITPEIKDGVFSR